MKWQDRGLVVSVKKYGENSLILTLFTENHGIHSGLVKYFSRKKKINIYQVGNILSIEWTGRLEEHLGFYKAELDKSYIYNILNNSFTLEALISLCTLIHKFLAERQLHNNLYIKSIELIKLMNIKDSVWLPAFIQWELILLTELGFGLDLSKCAVTGEYNNLNYVSPKSGRAVSSIGAGKWKNKLLSLPSFLININQKTIENNEFIAGVKLTTYFLNRYALSVGLRLPEARDRFTNKIYKKYN